MLIIFHAEIKKMIFFPLDLSYPKYSSASTQDNKILMVISQNMNIIGQPLSQNEIC